MEPKEMQEVLARFKEYYPKVQGLSITQMKGLLDGDLHMVKISGKKHKFLLMTTAEIAPGGKLDQMNAKIKARNAEIRRRNQEV